MSGLQWSQFESDAYLPGAYLSSCGLASCRCSTGGRLSAIVCLCDNLDVALICQKLADALAHQHVIVGQ
jgi:hypothetical protein